MEITKELERLRTALYGMRGFVGVRVQLGRPSKLCVDVSRDADVPAIDKVLQEAHLSNTAEIVSVGRRHVARALAARQIVGS